MFIVCGPLQLVTHLVGVQPEWKQIHIIQVSYNILSVQHLQHVFDHPLERSWRTRKPKTQLSILKQTKWRNKSSAGPHYTPLAQSHGIARDFRLL